MNEGGSSSSSVMAAMPSPSNVADSSKAVNYEFHSSIAEEERRFYLKAYPTVDVVRERKVHCTVCKTHIGTAPLAGIKMHPILRVTHCMKCHDFYNSGEFSKGEDGSELYCRWCGQGGEVYCCSSCPYVFCKSCIVKNLSRGVVADIEQNENWNCFSCAPKILWPLRAQHWALMNYIEQQKKEAYAMNLSETELSRHLRRDRSKCCRLAKAKCGNMSDSMESLDSVVSKRSHGSTGSDKKPLKHSATPSPQPPNAKRAKTNDEVVCTPDLLSMLEPDCQITLSQKPNQRPMASPSATTPRIMSIQQPSSYGLNATSTPKTSAPPPLVLRNTAIKLRPATQPPIVRRTVIGPRAPAPGGNAGGGGGGVGGGTPVYHTINGYRIDLNSAAQQETFRLPNGKLIQVKRQGPPPPVHMAPSPNSWQQMSSGQHPSPQQQQQQQQQQRVVPQTIASRPVQITQHPYPGPNGPQHPQVVRYHNSMIGSTTINAIAHNGTPLQAMNGQVSSVPQQNMQQNTMQQSAPGAPIRPVMVRHIFPENPIGQARTQLQEQVFNAMEICTHLTNKVQTLTNSNAYKQAKNYLEVKELYIHLSYLLTYAIGRFKGLQDKCLADMRHLGFGNDADCLENGQLAAAIDYVCYGQLDDVDLFNTGSNSFHNQVYEYRKSLHANLKDGEDGAKSPLPPLFTLGQGKSSEPPEDDGEGEDSLLEAPRSNLKGHWLEGGDDSSAPGGYGQENEENEEPDESYLDNDDDDGYNKGGYGAGGSFIQGTEESMRRNEETHAYDRKLTRLVSQYPSIWCTRHPDYGNFEVTRKQWRTITAHFDRKENIKLRWKNIRKRFVRIEKRIADGKRFNGHFDKAMAFLANRDLPTDQWVEVDCGEDDGDTYDRQHLDAIEKSLQRQGKDEFVDKRDRDRDAGQRDLYNYQPAVKPIEIEPLDLKIITFVKTNPVLWRKSMDPEADKIDEQTRSTVWNQLHKSLQTVSCEYIRDRWQHLYEMYKTFRLKTIKSHDDRSNLELKYSKYLAKLYFLYKIDEHELRNENNGLFEDCFELEDDEEAEREAETDRVADTEEDSGAEETEANAEAAASTTNNTHTTATSGPTKLQDMPDDKEFLQKLVQSVREFPAIWNTQHDDYNDIMVRDSYWQEIYEKLADFKHKQASDDEDNEIEIVEPKTDLINLDSDEDEPPPPPPPIKIQKPVTPSTPSTPSAPSTLQITKITIPPKANIQRTTTTPAASSNIMTSSGTYIPPPPPQAEDENLDLMTMAQSFLASMLEVDMNEGPQNSPSSSDSTQVKKQPRKKMTNKPNPTLLKQKAIMERERLEEMKRNDHKLKMKCAVQLKKAEDEYPFAKEMLEAKAREREQLAELAKEKENVKDTSSTTMIVNTGKETIEVQLVIEDDNMNSSTEEASVVENGRTKAILNISRGDENHGGDTPEKKIILIEEVEEKEEVKEKSPEKIDKSEKEIKETLQPKDSTDETKTKEPEAIKVDTTKEKTKAESTQEVVEKLTSTEVNKDASVEIFEISEEVVDKDSSSEIVETDKEKEIEKETPTNGVKETEKSTEREDKNSSPTTQASSPTAQEEPMEEDVDTMSPPNGFNAADDDDTKMEVETNEDATATKDIQMEDEEKEATTEDTKANEANKSKEDIEDAEVYEEIEKVLQRRHKEDTDEEEISTEAGVETGAEAQETATPADSADKTEIAMKQPTCTTEKETVDSEGGDKTEPPTPEKTSVIVQAPNKAATTEVGEKTPEKDSTTAEATLDIIEAVTAEISGAQEAAASPPSTSPQKTESNSPKVATTDISNRNSSCADDVSSDTKTKEQTAAAPTATDSCDPEEITSNGSV